MAITTIAAPLSGIRGKLAGLIFSANGAGNYVKKWGRSTNPRTVKQQAVRNNLDDLAGGWMALSSANKVLWDTYAALPAQDRTNSLGATFSASGFNWFVKINSQLDQVARARRTTPPTLTRPTAPTISIARFYSTASGLTSRIHILPAEFTAADAIVNSRIFARSTARTIPNRKTFTVMNLLPAATTVPFQTELEEIYGTVIEDNLGVYWLQRQDLHGQRSLPTTATGFFLP